MEIGHRKGDVILLQQRERNKGTQTGDMALNESDVVLCVEVITASFSIQLVKCKHEVWLVDRIIILSCLLCSNAPNQHTTKAI